MSTILSLALLLISLLVIVIFVSVFTYALKRTYGGAFERMTFRRQCARSAVVDELVAKSDLAGAAQALGNSFCIMHIRWDPLLLGRVADYHAGLLSRFLIVGDEAGPHTIRANSLGRVDKLLSRRSELHDSFFTSVGLADGTELKNEQLIEENGHELRHAIDQLVLEITALGREPRTYH